mmetsp:Transcript_100253/g.261361  ORF Transcript_100253/g.261361 Transcript_100253/m.261361 type:complete len:245 (+) Transcript_100253:471-1205(+)
MRVGLRLDAVQLPLQAGALLAHLAAGQHGAAGVRGVALGLRVGPLSRPARGTLRPRAARRAARGAVRGALWRRCSAQLRGRGGHLRQAGLPQGGHAGVRGLELLPQAPVALLLLGDALLHRPVLLLGSAALLLEPGGRLQRGDRIAAVHALDEALARLRLGAGELEPRDLRPQPRWRGRPLGRLALQLRAQRRHEGVGVRLLRHGLQLPEPGCHVRCRQHGARQRGAEGGGRAGRAGPREGPRG